MDCRILSQKVDILSFKQKNTPNNMFTKLHFPSVCSFQYKNSEKIKVKCTLVQVLKFCTGRTAHRGSISIALLFLDHRTRRG